MTNETVLSAGGVCMGWLIALAGIGLLPGCHHEAGRSRQGIGAPEFDRVVAFHTVPVVKPATDTKNDSTFHGYQVLERKVLDRTAARELVRLLNEDATFSTSDIPMCFAPTFGARVIHGHEETDVLIWFEGHRVSIVGQEELALSSRGRSRLELFYRRLFPTAAERASAGGPCA